MWDTDVWWPRGVCETVQTTTNQTRLHAGRRRTGARHTLWQCLLSNYHLSIWGSSGTNVLAIHGLNRKLCCIGVHLLVFFHFFVQACSKNNIVKGQIAEKTWTNSRQQMDLDCNFCMVKWWPTTNYSTQPFFFIFICRCNLSHSSSTKIIDSIVLTYGNTDFLLVFCANHIVNEAVVRYNFEHSLDVWITCHNSKWLNNESTQLRNNN